MKRVNIHEVELQTDGDEPEGYDPPYARLGTPLGSKKTGATLYELPPGHSVCPYHYEVGEEEWLLVVRARPSVRHPDGEDELKPGDVVFFEEGPAGAHKITNHSAADARVLMWSTRNHPALAVYPDSNKIGVFVPYDEDRLMLRRAPNLDYWDGES